MHRLNAPSSSFFFFVQHGFRFVGPRFDKLPNCVGPDQRLHTMVSDLGLIVCFFCCFDGRKTRV